ncbi:MAG: sulfotransferase domain-containing protein [Phycisphaerales bacterium]|nr:sulfotransferase domain-containing protein [Phycisphaerales bacterium]
MFRNDHLTDDELATLAKTHGRRHGPLIVLRGKPLRNLQHIIESKRHRYPHRNLFVAGLPKSGTTWLERMLVDVPGYRKWIPGYIPQTGHDLLPGTLTDPPVGYTVTRVHTQPKDRNVAILHETGRPYVILYRDPRDVIVSSFFYARNDPDVVMHERAKGMELPTWIDFFIDARLGEYLDWCIGWLDKKHPTRGAVFHYESLLTDTRAQFARIASHFELGLSDETVKRIADAHSFKAATGRSPGQEDMTSFNRKGVAGDWKNHFTKEQIAHFNSVAGARLATIGYESA